MTERDNQRSKVYKAERAALAGRVLDLDQWSFKVTVERMAHARAARQAA